MSGKSFNMSDREKNTYAERCKKTADGFHALANAIQEDDPITGAVELSLLMHTGGELIGDLRRILVEEVFADVAKVMNEDAGDGPPPETE